MDENIDSDNEYQLQPLPQPQPQPQPTHLLQSSQQSQPSLPSLQEPIISITPQVTPQTTPQPKPLAKNQTFSDYVANDEHIQIKMEPNTSNSQTIELASPKHSESDLVAALEDHESPQHSVRTKSPSRQISNRIIQLATIVDDKEFVSEIVLKKLHKKSSVQSDNAYEIAIDDQSKEIVPKAKRSSNTYHYPEDFHDIQQAEAEREEVEEKEFSITRERSLTNTVSKLPKALQILGVNGEKTGNVGNELEEVSVTKLRPKYSKSTTVKVDALSVPNTSMENVAVFDEKSKKSLDQKEDTGYLYPQYPGHAPQLSRTHSPEPSIWELMVNDGILGSQTVKSMQELAEYTVSANARRMSTEL